MWAQFQSECRNFRRFVEYSSEEYAIYFNQILLVVHATFSFSVPDSRRHLWPGDKKLLASIVAIVVVVVVVVVVGSTSTTFH